MTALLVITYDAVAHDDRGKRRPVSHLTADHQLSLAARVRTAIDRLTEPQPAARYEAIFATERNYLKPH